MLELLFRKRILSKVDKEARAYARTLKDKYKVNFFATAIVFIFFSIPLASLLSYVVVIEHTIFNFVVGGFCVVLLGGGTIYFINRFAFEIMRFKDDIAINMYNKRYLRKGNALSDEDFKTLKENNGDLYYLITRLMAHGFCYNVCFELLKTLKKGEMLYVAVYTGVGETEGQKYTMHVLYVNGDWCYDTYSEKQLPLEKVLSLSKGKTYRSFSYDDIKDKSYDEFRYEESIELKQWCINNDCFEKFMDD